MGLIERQNGEFKYFWILSAVHLKTKMVKLNIFGFCQATQKVPKEARYDSVFATSLGNAKKHRISNHLYYAR